MRYGLRSIKKAFHSMTYEDIAFDISGGVASIILNRPDDFNGMTRQMRGELTHAITHAGANARAILITGAGDAFCAGDDLGAGRNAVDIDLERLTRDELTPLLKAIEASDAPIICAVNGAAAGTGASLALACDIVIAARSASFAQSQTRAGLMPDMAGTFMLPRLVGLPRALGMALFAEPIPAPQAAEWGLIWEVVDDTGLTARAAELAARLAEGPTRAYAAIRRTMRQSLSRSMDDHMAEEARQQGALGQSRDFAEGVDAFLDGRRPDFEGR